MLKLIDYADKSKSKWIEVCYYYEAKQGCDEDVDVIAKFKNKRYAREFATMIRNATVGPDAIIIR